MTVTRLAYNRWAGRCAKQPRPVVNPGERIDMTERTRRHRALPWHRRLLAKFTVGDDCWLWTAGLDAYGYGAFWDNDRKVKAHRVVYEWLIGPIPDGMHIDHLCRVRNCVRPDHLEPVTNATNILRGHGSPAVNARKTHCIHGHGFSPENTYRTNDGRRQCVECIRAQGARRWAPAALAEGSDVLPTQEDH